MPYVFQSFCALVISPMFVVDSIMSPLIASTLTSISFPSRMSFNRNPPPYDESSTDLEVHERIKSTEPSHSLGHGPILAGTPLNIYFLPS